MKWNFDLDIAASMFLAALLLYYVRRKNIPIRRNHIFCGMMSVALGVALSDMAATVMIVEEAPLVLNYGLNMLYYSLLAISPALFCFYCLAMTGFLSEAMRKDRTVLLHTPVMLVLLIVLSTPVSHVVFSVTKERGFQFGWGRIFLYVETMIYLLGSLLHVWHHRKKLRRLYRSSLIAYAILVCIGHTIQVFFTPYLQTVSLSVSLGLLVMFLCYQHPDFYRNHATSLLDAEGLDMLLENDYDYKKHRKVALLAFENYDEIKTTYGDEVNRQLLEVVGFYLRAEFYMTDQFYVHNGRFLLFTSSVDQLSAYRNKVLERCRHPFAVANAEFWLKPCFAYAEDSLVFASHEELRECMHIAIEEALHKGSGATVKVDEVIFGKAQRGLKVDAALERAVHGEGLEVFYQPIFSTKEGCVMSAEALVRIRDKELGLLFPDEFIWKAEENGSILMLGHRVIENVCKFIVENDMKKLGLSYIEVNLSPVQCVREQLAEELKTIVDTYGIDPGYLNLEITETGNTDSAITNSNMQELLKYGMTFSLDDYGTGFSNLDNVLRMPLSIVKIDKSIVWAYFDNKNQMLVHVLEIFKESHLKTVAEGIETEEMAKALTEMGCDYLQGYYFSKPVPEQDFLAYLEAA